ncbi:MAG: hypothetical protein KC649_07030, partial [Candidatus Omnitrophica bacterium]|nr:hypothetical protein [Candidatus Omnitrophota bacterium]
REYSQIEQDIRQKRPSSSVRAYRSLLATDSPKLTPKIARAYLTLTAGAEGARRLLRARKSIIDVLKSNILASVIALGGQTLEEKFGVDSSDNFSAFDSVFSGSKSQLLRQLFEPLSLMPQEGDVLFFSRSDAERLGIRNIRSEGIALKLTEVTSGAVTAVLSDGKTKKLGAMVIQRSVLDPLITKDSFAGSQNQGSRLSTASINNDEEPSSNPEAGYSLLLEQARLRWGDSLNFSQSYLRVAGNNLYAHLTQLGITRLDIAVIFLSLASSVRAKDVKAEKSVVDALLEPNILRILNNDLSKGYEVLLEALKTSGKVQTEAAQRNQDLYRVSGRLYLKLIAEGLDASSIQDRFGELINRSVDSSSLVSNLNVSYYGFRNALQDQLILSGLSDSLPIAEVVDIPEAEVLPDSLPIAEVVDIPEAAEYVSGGRLALSGSEGEDGGIIPDSFFMIFGVEGWNPEGVDLNSLLDEQAARTIASSELNIAVPITSTDAAILSV